MQNMNISLPDGMKQFVATQAGELGLGSDSDYICQLIRNEQKKRAEQRLVALIEEGRNSGEPIEIDENYWKEKKEKWMKM